MTLKALIFLCLGGIFFFTPTPTQAGVLEDNHCGSCHRLNAEDTNTNPAGPDLHYAGQKFQPQWLKQFLKKPAVIRPSGLTTDPSFLQGTPDNMSPHPSFSEEDTSKLVASLMNLKSVESNFEPVGTEPLSKGQRAKIKYQFERTFGCISCHQSLNLAGKVRGGVSGPSLVNSGNRLQAEWVNHWLQKPEVFISKSRMPRYKLDALTRDQLTQFLMTLKNENIR
ncbi:MAG: c-type cytochrome [Nitrospinaceae bacterium]|nr:c-type cytochrome [Nitrospinaceae bacterium]